MKILSRILSYDREKHFLFIIFFVIKYFRSYFLCKKCFANFIEIALWHAGSSVTLLHIFRTTFPKFCVSYGAFSHFCYRETTNSFIFVYFLLHIHIGFSWHNHVENCFFCSRGNYVRGWYYLHNFKLFISFQECK